MLRGKQVQSLKSHGNENHSQRVSEKRAETPLPGALGGGVAIHTVEAAPSWPHPSHMIHLTQPPLGFSVHTSTQNARAHTRTHPNALLHGTK